MMADDVHTIPVTSVSPQDRELRAMRRLHLNGDLSWELADASEAAHLPDEGLAAINQESHAGPCRAHLGAREQRAMPVDCGCD